MHNLSDYITEWISSGRRNKEQTIIATDETIHQIVKKELDRLGHDADLNHIDVSRVTNIESLFSCLEPGPTSPSRSPSLGPKYIDINPDISKWNTSNIKRMDRTFQWCENFNCDISGWDVSNVIDMDFMFVGCKKFNQDISCWDVKNVESMAYMFKDCSNFNQNLSNWGVTKVKYMFAIFGNCPIKKEFKPKFK